MKTQPTYDFITQKLGRKSAPDTAALWKGMKEVLDREMPQEKKNPFAWLFTMNAWLLLLSLSGLAAALMFFNRRPENIAVMSAPTKTSATAAQPVPAQPQQTAVAYTSPRTVPSNETSARAGQTAGHQLPEASASVAANAQGYAKTNVLNDKSAGGTSALNEKRVSKGFAFNGKTSDNASTAAAKHRANISSDKNHSNTSVNTGDQLATTNAFFNQEELPTLGHHVSSFALHAKRGFRFNAPAAPNRKDIASRLTPSITHHGRGFSAGVGLHLSVPISDQARSNVNYKGQQGNALDYLPSVFIQYHFNKRFSLRSGLQWMAPQYVDQYSMYEEYSDASANHYREDNITLRKLYYLTVPLTVQYQFRNHIQLGGGIEYARLSRTIFEKQACLWQQDNGNWWKPWEDNNMKAMSANSDEGAVSTPLDTANYSIHRTDWRLTLNAAYQWKRLEFGLKASTGIRPYVNTTQKGYYDAPLRDVNRSLQFYLHYTLFNRRTR